MSGLRGPERQAEMVRLLANPDIITPSLIVRLNMFTRKGAQT